MIPLVPESCTFPSEGVVQQVLTSFFGRSKLVQHAQNIQVAGVCLPVSVDGKRNLPAALRDMDVDEDADPCNAQTTDKEPAGRGSQGLGGQLCLQGCEAWMRRLSLDSILRCFTAAKSRGSLWPLPRSQASSCSKCPWCEPRPQAS